MTDPEFRRISGDPAGSCVERNVLLRRIRPDIPSLRTDAIAGGTLCAATEAAHPN